MSIRMRMVRYEKTPPLSVAKWIEAAFRALTKNGPQGIRAELIARDLEVSKGSFYWHFKDVPALKSAMLEHWEDAATNAVISNLEESGAAAPDRLKRLVEIATSKNNKPYGGVLAEAAIRDWGRYDDAAAQCVETVDRQRLAYLFALFKECGQSKIIAQGNANILYGTLIGLEALSHRGLVKLENDLQNLLTRLIIK